MASFHLFCVRGGRTEGSVMASGKNQVSNLPRHLKAEANLCWWCGFCLAVLSPMTDLPSPQNVSAVAMGNNSILVSWKPPIKSTASINGYVVEWINTHRKSSLEPHPSWIRLVASNLSIVIPGEQHREAGYCWCTILIVKAFQGTNQTLIVTNAA